MLKNTNILLSFFAIIILISCESIETSTKVNNPISIIEEEETIEIFEAENDTTVQWESGFNSNSIHEEFEEKRIFFTKDSLGKLNGGHITYYTNGYKEKGQTLDDFGCGMYSGMFYLYDSTDKLLRTTKYDNWLQKKAEGCHETMHDIYIVEYFANGKVKSKKMIQSCYECEEWNAGVWQEFDSTGKITNEKDYGLKYLKK